MTRKSSEDEKTKDVADKGNRKLRQSSQSHDVSSYLGQVQDAALTFYDVIHFTSRIKVTSGERRRIEIILRNILLSKKNIST